MTNHRGESIRGDAWPRRGKTHLHFLHREFVAQRQFYRDMLALLGHQARQLRAHTRSLVGLASVVTDLRKQVRAGFARANRRADGFDRKLDLILKKLG